MGPLGQVYNPRGVNAFYALFFFHPVPHGPINTVHTMIPSLWLLFFSLLAWCEAAVVPFVITLTWGTVAPDGVPRKAILTNGQFPGPALYLDQGDEVEFLVVNFLPFSTTVHFHGMSVTYMERTRA
jgi:hypothetical protein